MNLWTVWAKPALLNQMSLLGEKVFFFFLGWQLLGLHDRWVEQSNVAMESPESIDDGAPKRDVNVGL